MGRLVNGRPVGRPPGAVEECPVHRWVSSARNGRRWPKGKWVKRCPGEGRSCRRWRSSKTSPLHQLCTRCLRQRCESLILLRHLAGRHTLSGAYLVTRNRGRVPVATAPRQRRCRPWPHLRRFRASRNSLRLLNLGPSEKSMHACVG